MPRVFLTITLLGAFANTTPCLATDLRSAIDTAPGFYLSGSAAKTQADEGPGETGIKARGIVRAGEQVEISAPVSLKLDSAPHRAGHRVSKGDVLARFDCTRQRADLVAQEKAVETLNLRYQSERELAAYGANSEYDVALAESERDQAQAQADAMRASLDDCVVTAPFNADIAVRHVSPFETPRIGQPLYSLIRAGDHEISVIVPAQMGYKLNVGAEFQFRLDVESAPFPVRITRLAPDIDPVSQTLEIIAKPRRSKKLRPGMSGEAIFSPSEF